MKPRLYTARISHSIRRDGVWCAMQTAESKLKAFDDANAERRARNQLTLRLVHERRIAGPDDLRFHLVQVAAVPMEGKRHG